MKIEIQKEEELVVIELQGLKGREVKKARDLMLGLAEIEDEKAQVQGVRDYSDFIEELAGNISGMTIEELDDLDIDEKTKLTSYVQGKVDNSINFLKSSSPAGNSRQRETKR